MFNDAVCTSGYINLVSNDRIICKKSAGKNVEERGRGLFYGILPAFAWRKRQKRREISEWPASRQEFETGASYYSLERNMQTKENSGQITVHNYKRRTPENPSLLVT